MGVNKKDGADSMLGKPPDVGTAIGTLLANLYMNNYKERGVAKGVDAANKEFETTFGSLLPQAPQPQQLPTQPQGVAEQVPNTEQTQQQVGVAPIAIANTAPQPTYQPFTQEAGNGIWEKIRREQGLSDVQLAEVQNRFAPRLAEYKNREETNTLNSFINEYGQAKDMNERANVFARAYQKNPELAKAQLTILSNLENFTNSQHNRELSDKRFQQEVENNKERLRIAEMQAVNRASGTGGRGGSDNSGMGVNDYLSLTKRIDEVNDKITNTTDAKIKDELVLEKARLHALLGRTPTSSSSGGSPSVAGVTTGQQKELLTNLLPQFMNAENTNFTNYPQQEVMLVKHLVNSGIPEDSAKTLIRQYTTNDETLKHYVPDTQAYNDFVAKNKAEYAAKRNELAEAQRIREEERLARYGGQVGYSQPLRQGETILDSIRNYVGSKYGKK